MNCTAAITSPPAQRVLAAQPSTTMQVRAQPRPAGGWSTTLQVESHDPMKHPYVITLSSTATTDPSTQTPANKVNANAPVSCGAGAALGVLLLAFGLLPWRRGPTARRR